MPLPELLLSPGFLLPRGKSLHGTFSISRPLQWGWLAALPCTFTGLPSCMCPGPSSVLTHGLQSIQARPSESAWTKAVSNTYMLREVEVFIRLSNTGLGVRYSYRHVPPGFPDHLHRGGAGLLLSLRVDVLYPRSASFGPWLCSPLLLLSGHSYDFIVNRILYFL